MDRKIVIWNLKMVEKNLHISSNDAYTIRLALDLLSSNWRIAKNIEDIVLRENPIVTKKDIYDFRLNLFTISMEYGNYHELDEENEEELETRELNYIQTYFKSKGMRVEEKKEG